MRILLSSAFILICSLALNAQVEMNSVRTVAVIKGSYIYNFAKSCNWDESFYEEDIFRIAVYGDRELHDELLDKYSTRSINNQIVEVIWVTDLDRLSNEQLVFVSKFKEKEIAKASALCEENSSLLITDFDGALSRGSVINFTVIDNMISYDLNEMQARKNLVLLGTRTKSWANKIIEK
ncbi:MAG: YfiR family protein [Flavobacteriales bacterium]